MVRPAQLGDKVSFGKFELDLVTAELRSNGSKAVLPGQPFQILVTLLARQGELVSREELKRQLWPSDTFVDFDVSLNKAVNRLREALGDSAEHPHFIETLPKRGYRFIGGIEPMNGDGREPKSDHHRDEEEALETKPAYPASDARNSLLTNTRIGGVLVILALVAFGAYRWTNRPLRTPKVVRTVRLTNDGWRKFALLSDGVRVYFSEGGSLFQSSAAGGETTELPIGLHDIDLFDISPSGSELLIASGVQTSETEERSIWTVAVPAGTPHKIGDLKGLWATWAPDGEHFSYASRNAIYFAKKDATEIRKLADIAVVPWKLQFSPDGRRLRFDGYDSVRNVDSIWEMSLDQGQIHLLLPQWVVPQHTGSWTADGRYFFFNTHDPVKDRDESVWVMDESGRARSSPAQLTRDPLAFGYPFPSADGKRVFVLGTLSRAELTRYDSHKKQFLPFLAGISAREAEISRDGNWVAYVSYPDLTLWRSRLDGSERVQLTFPPVEVVGPRWSPDGTHIAFADLQPGKLSKISTIPALGGITQEILPGDTRAQTDPSWWPDGKSIVFGRSYFAGKGGIERVDLASHEVSSVQGSERFFSPRLSPDGSKIAAFAEQGSKLMLYDFRSREWRDAAPGIFQFNIWSRDGKSIFMLDLQGGTIVRFEVDRGKLVKVADLQGIEQGSKGWVGLALDDSPLIVRDKSVSDVYRLDLETP